MQIQDLVHHFSLGFLVCALGNQRELKSEIVLGGCLKKSLVVSIWGADAYNFIRAYLLVRGYGEDAAEGFQVSNEFRELIRRSQSLNVPFSYAPLFLDLIHGKRSTEPDRALNIKGSADTHQRYFLPVISQMKRGVSSLRVIDIGCGNGGFIANLLASCGSRVNVQAFGVDVSDISINTFNSRFERYSKIASMKCDGFDVEQWSTAVKQFLLTDPDYISLWFLIHELRNFRITEVQDFFCQLQQRFPRTALVLTDLVRPRLEAFATNALTVMPEYTLFHDLSGQSLLDQQTWNSMLESIPYEVTASRQYDTRVLSDGRQEHSVITVFLSPISEEEFLNA